MTPQNVLEARTRLSQCRLVPSHAAAASARCHRLPRVQSAVARGAALLLGVRSRGAAGRAAVPALPRASCAGSVPSRWSWPGSRSGRRWPTRARRGRSCAALKYRGAAGLAEPHGGPDRRRRARRAARPRRPRWCRCRCTRAGAAGAASTRPSGCRRRWPRRTGLPVSDCLGRGGAAQRQVGRDRAAAPRGAGGPDRASRQAAARPRAPCWSTTWPPPAPRSRPAPPRSSGPGRSRSRPSPTPARPGAEHCRELRGWQRPGLGVPSVATPTATARRGRMRIDVKGRNVTVDDELRERVSQEVREGREAGVRARRHGGRADRGAQPVHPGLPGRRGHPPPQGRHPPRARGVGGHGPLDQPGRGGPLPPGQAPPREAPQAPRGQAGLAADRPDRRPRPATRAAAAPRRTGCRPAARPPRC